MLRRLLAGAARAGAESVAGLAAVARTGVLRPLRPSAAARLALRVATGGIGADLVYALHGLQDPLLPALIYEDRTTTWGEMYERVLRLANHLLDLGVRPRDAVAVMLPNRPEFLESQAAALRIGATVALVSPSMPAEAAADLLGRVEPKIVITHREDLPSGVPTLLVGDDYQQAIRSADPGEPGVRSASGRIVIFTSGTTGRPKGAVRSMTSSASPNTLGLLRVVPFRRSDVHLTVCPLYHASGSGFTMSAHALGSPVVLLPKFTPQGFCDAVSEHKVTATAVVPTMLHELVEWPKARDYDLSSLRVVVCTGSPLREEVRTAAREILGDVVYDLYGSTEMAWVSVATPEDQRRRPGTVGRPVPGVEVRIVKPDGTEAARGERGEIWAANPASMQGYFKDPELTSKRMRDGFVSVGDVGIIDEDGYLHVVDRLDDMIISGGVNVYPAETEVVLGSHPGVGEVAVVGVPDPKWGQRVVAAVVPRGDADPQDLVDYCKERLPAAAVPKEVRLVESLPRNDVGKVAKRLIAASWDDSSIQT